MSQLREACIIIATGTRGVGKTHTTCSTIQRYIQPDFTSGKKARKVLIYDVNEEYTNEEIAKKGFNFIAPVLALKDLPEWTKQQRAEVRRILPRDENGKLLDADQMVEILNEILEIYKGGLLLLEDINAYLIGTNTKTVISTIVRNRHKDLDIYIHLQSLGPVTPRMWQNCDFLRLHKQMDDISRYQHRIPSAEKYFIAEKLVDMKYKENKRFYCYVDNKEHKITGEFDKKIYMVAAYSYLLDNPKMIKNAEARLVNSKYAPHQRRELALKLKITELMKYYGNSN